MAIMRWQAPRPGEESGQEKVVDKADTRHTPDMKPIAKSESAAFERLLDGVQSAKRKHMPKSNRQRPWLRHAGWAKDDPIYDEAMKRGEEYRKSS
jgi:hypothetical protein